MSTSQWVGIAVGILGLAVLAGLAAHIAALVQIQTGRDASMSVDAGIGLVLGGLILLLSDAGRGGRVAARVLAVALGVLSVAVLIEETFHVSLGIDFPRTHYWIGDPAVYPGRMAPDTAVAFLVLALAALLPRVRGMRAAKLRRGLGITVAAIGGLGVLGYLVHVEEIFYRGGAPAMAFYSADGLIALGLGWCCGRQLERYQPPRRAQYRRILTVAAVVLVVAMAGAGLGGAVLLWRLNARDATTNLSLRRDERVQFIEALIGNARSNGHAMATAIGATFLLNGSLPPAAALKAEPGVAGVELLGTDNSVLERSGTLVQHPALTLPVGPHASLMWSDGAPAPAGTVQNGFVLRQDLPLESNGIGVGRVVVEQPLPLMASVGVESASWGKSGEMSLCGLATPGGTDLRCFPQRLRPRVVTVPGVYHRLRMPMLRALDGATGVMVAVDYRGKRALSAYAPIPNLGLGLVVKMDTDELYTAVRHQLEIMLPLLLLVTFGGLMALRSQVRPLLNQLVESRNRAIYNEARFRAAADSSMDGFFIFEAVRDPQTAAIANFQLTYANPPGRLLAGITDRPATLAALAQMTALDAYQSIAPEGGLFDALSEIVRSRRSWVTEYPVPNSREPRVWLHLQAVALGDGAALTVRDVTERKLRESQLEFLAQNDPLTGLVNRRAFLSRLEHAMESSRRLRSQSLLALLFLDIDRFKQVNDRFGHSQGDVLLRAFANRLNACVRSADTVARLGGDEFTILLENLQSPADAERVVEAIFDALRPEVELEPHPIKVSTSIGVAYFRGEAIGPDELLQRADAALYAAKREGRNRWRVYPALAAG